MRHHVRMVKGPALVRITGECCILGSAFSDTEIAVRAGKMLPFEVGRECKFEIEFGPGGDTWIAESHRAGTAMWTSASARVVRMAHANKGLVALVVGDSDAGKTTFSTFLANSCLGVGLVPQLIDADIGQGDLAPPGVIGSVQIESQIIDLRDIGPQKTRFEFVGRLSPAGYEDIVIERVKAGLEATKSFNDTIDIFIINTDGYVRGGGIPYKVRMTNVLQADVIICLGMTNSLDEIFRWTTRARIIKARASSYATKSQSERVERRIQQLSRFIGSGLVCKQFADIRLIYHEKQMLPIQPIKLSIGTFIGLGMGVKIIGFGCIVGKNPDSIIIRTDLNADDIETVFLSDIRASSGDSQEISQSEYVE